MSAVRRALVVGGGIGGLAIAGALQRLGVEVHVVERARAWEPLGAGLLLSTNAIAVLEALGVQAARANSLALPVMEIRSARDDLLQALSSTDAPRSIHRAVLHELLLKAAAKVHLHLGTQVTAVEQTEHEVRCQLSDGSTQVVDLLVGADGANSALRGLLYPAAGARLIYAGYTCWRTVVPNTIKLDRAVEYWGNGQRVGLVPLPHQQVYMFLTDNTAAGGRDDTQHARAHLVARFARFHGEVAQLIAAIAESETAPLLRHDIADLSQAVWGDERVAMLGDASHATTPNLGQGAAMALEDALSLTLALRQSRHVAEALAAYRAERAPRVDAIVRSSRQIGGVAQWSHPLACAVRNAAMRWTPPSVNRRLLDDLVRPGVALAERASTSGLAAALAT